jgi:hypothetical protein
MSGRDRIIAMVVGVLVIVAAGWVLLVSPERQKATKLNAQIASAQGEVSSAESQLSEARAAQAKYSDAYAAVVNLGKAVPPSQEVASLIYQLEGATTSKSVQFNSIVSGAGAIASPGASTPAAAAAGFTQMPFTFIFEGGFGNLEHLFDQLTSFTNHDASGGLHVAGRLLSVTSVKLTPAPTGTAANGLLSGTITASAYVLPAGEGLTAGATATSPTGTATTPAASGTTSSTSSPTAPAVARVTP